MSITAGTVITIARQKLHDTVISPNTEADCRWRDTVLYSYLDSAHRDVYRLRPDLFLSSTGNAITGLTTITGTSSTVVLSASFRECLAYAVASAALAEDTDDPANASQSKLFYSKFIEGLS